MKLRSIAELLKAQILAGEDLLEKEVTNGFCTDVTADVLAYSTPDTVLITRLHNLSVVRSALMTDCHCIIFSDGMQPAPEILSLAEDHELAVMAVEDTMFQAVSLLLDAGLDEADWT